MISKNSLQIFAFIFTIFSGELAFGFSDQFQSQISTEIDSLVLQNKESNEMVFIGKGSKVKIWSNGKTYKGNFIGISDMVITLQQKKGQIKIDCKTIIKIKDISDPLKNFFGGVIFINSAYMFGATGALLGIGVYSLIKEGTILIVFAVLPAALSLGLLKLGKLIRGPEYRMDKNWVISEKNLLIL